MVNTEVLNNVGIQYLNRKCARLVMIELYPCLGAKILAIVTVLSSRNLLNVNGLTCNGSSQSTDLFTTSRIISETRQSCADMTPSLLRSYLHKAET